LKRIRFTQKLPDTPDTQETFAITNHWRQHRAAAGNLVKSIKLFAALERGDTSILLDCFPWLKSAMAAPMATAVYRSTLPTADLEITIVEKSEAENLSDLFSEFGGVEF
jgi:hypothetical protein